MSEQTQPTEPHPDPDFIDKSSLTYFIPRATAFSLGQLSQDGDLPFDQILDSVEKRESLFFDESVDVVVVLRAPSLEEEGLQSLLNGLVISLEVQIVNGSSPDRDGSSASEVIYNGTVNGSEDAPVLIHSSFDGDANSGGDGERYAFALWKKAVFLSRPRMRLQGPVAAFVATATSKSVTDPPPEETQLDYIPSGTVSSLNLLEPFGSDPALNGVKPRLSALRVSRVAPLTQQSNDLVRPIKSSSKLSLRIYPAVHSRIRFTHPYTAPATAAVIAILEFDFTPFVECEVVLDDISLTILDATVEDLTKQAGLSLPLSCVSHDHITFIYRITPVETDVVSQNLMRELNIAISTVALVSPHTKPRLRMAWTTTVDFTVPMNPGYGPTIQPIQRAHRPSQLSIGGENTTSLTAPSVARPDALPSLEASTTQVEASVQELGITVTFTAPSPSRKFFVGDEFSWEVFVANQSPNPSTAARKFAMVVIPRRRHNESRVTRPPSIHRAQGSLHKRHGLPRDGGVAEAVLDDNVVHAMQSKSVIDNAELICLSADVRIGPLAPGTCHATELKFLAVKEGVVGVDAIRIIDLGNNEHVDIRELPSIMINKPEAP